MRERSYRVILWSLAVIGIAADQASKYGFFAWLRGVESHTFALFQTEPQSRYFATVPADEAEGAHRGFFIEVAFKRDPMTHEYATDANGRLVPYVNQGALFGWKAGLTPEQSNGAFAIISLLAAAAILYWSAQKSTAGDRWLCVALGLILAGTLGNLYDRLMFNGVRDFLHWHYAFDWPVFNLADCCLVVGASLLLLQAFFAPASKPAQSDKAAELAVGATSQG
jgi:lipoprotein signal peptidase